MKKQTIVRFESTQPMTGSEIINVVSEIRSAIKEHWASNVEPEIRTHGEGGAVYKIEGRLEVEDVQL